MDHNKFLMEFHYSSHFADYDNIMSFFTGGIVYLARCGWGHGTATPPSTLYYDNIMRFLQGRRHAYQLGWSGWELSTGPRWGLVAHGTKPHQATYLVPSQEKLMMLNTIGKNKGKRARFPSGKNSKTSLYSIQKGDPGPLGKNKRKMTPFGRMSKNCVHSFNIVLHLIYEKILTLHTSSERLTSSCMTVESAQLRA